MAGTVGATTLSVAQLASHNHAGAQRNGQSWDETSGWESGHPNFVNPGVNTTGNSGGSQSHTHSLAASTGSAGNLPPYYALAYIMRL